MIGLILESILLIVNAIAILNEKRFLKKCKKCLDIIDGFDTLSAQPNSPNEMITSKSQIIMMAFTIRSVGKCNILYIILDVLIPLNIIAIFF
jgi:hypothetical protein